MFRVAMPLIGDFIYAKHALFLPERLVDKARILYFVEHSFKTQIVFFVKGGLGDTLWVRYFIDVVKPVLIAEILGGFAAEESCFTTAIS